MGTIRSLLLTHRNLALENLALRQQLAVFKHQYPRPALHQSDRAFWVFLSRFWSNWRSSLHFVQPATVIRWHRQGFKYYWTWKCRHKGRPKIDRELRQLIRKISQSNPLWGAPRIHGELLKLGFSVSEATVSKYMIRHSCPPSQSWRTFLDNHTKESISLDFFVVPTATFRVLFVLLILSNDRRNILHFNVTTNPTAYWTARQLLESCGFEEAPKYLIRDRDAIYSKTFSHQANVLNIREVVTAPRSPWQNPYVERVIGSIRRECVNHLIVLGERHLKRVLRAYVDYYNHTRTHLSLEKDAPIARESQNIEDGNVISIRRVGGLHHEYRRMAA